MSSIGSIGMNSVSSMQRPDPMGVFKKTDSDGSGGVSQAELKNLADVMKEKTGNTIDVSNDSFKTYDSNNNGSLSGDELKSVLDSIGFGPPQGMQGMGAPPPPPPPQQVADSYEANSAGSGQQTVSELLSTLKALLEKLTADSDTSLQNSSDQSVSSSSQDQIKEFQKLLEALTTYVNSNNSDSNTLISIYT